MLYILNIYKFAFKQINVIRLTSLRTVYLYTFKLQDDYNDDDVDDDGDDDDNIFNKIKYFDFITPKKCTK